MVAHHHVILPLAAELEKVLDVHAATTKLLVRTPFSLIDVLFRFQDPKPFLLSIRHASIVCISVFINTGGGRTDLLVRSLPWLFNQSVLLPVVMLKNTLILPQWFAVLAQWT
jgi:hypothetical protein